MKRVIKNQDRVRHEGGSRLPVGPRGNQLTAAVYEILSHYVHDCRELPVAWAQEKLNTFQRYSSSLLCTT